MSEIPAGADPVWQPSFDQQGRLYYLRSIFLEGEPKLMLNCYFVLPSLSSDSNSEAAVDS